MSRNNGITSVFPLSLSFSLSFSLFHSLCTRHDEPSDVAEIQVTRPTRYSNGQKEGDGYAKHEKAFDKQFSSC